MSEQKKSTEELLFELHKLEKHSKGKTRTLPSENDKANEGNRTSRKWKKAMEYAKASLAMEELYVTPEIEALVLKSLEGEITEEDFLKQALKLASR